MKKIIPLIIILLIVLFNTGFNKAQDNTNIENKNKCITCHIELDYMPENFSRADIHFNTEFSCVGCHGGDPTSQNEEASMDPNKGFIGIPDVENIPVLCGKCHSDINFMRVFQPSIATDQVNQYYTSQHGKLLKSGDSNVATCISCHTAHAIMPATDPRSSVNALNIPVTCNLCHGDEDHMSSYDLTTNQYEEYAESVHGIALLKNHDTGAPACNDCHGNHGALPPGISSISNVCGLCHANNMNYFNNSRMAKNVELSDFHSCEQCHGNHAIKKTNDSMIGINEQSICMECHDEGDAGYNTAKSIGSDIKGLVFLYDSASVKLDEVKRKGMNDVDINFLLKDTKQTLIQARTLIHTFDEKIVAEKTGEGKKLVIEAINQADEEVDEYFTRRNGFAAATLLFFVFALALYFKIKDIGNRKTIE